MGEERKGPPHHQAQGNSMAHDHHTPPGSPLPNHPMKALTASHTGPRQPPVAPSGPCSSPSRPLAGPHTPSAWPCTDHIYGLPKQSDADRPCKPLSLLLRWVDQATTSIPTATLTAAAATPTTTYACFSTLFLSSSPAFLALSCHHPIHRQTGMCHRQAVTVPPQSSISTNKFPVHIPITLLLPLLQPNPLL